MGGRSIMALYTVYNFPRPNPATQFAPLETHCLQFLRFHDAVPRWCCYVLSIGFSFSLRCTLAISCLADSACSDNPGIGLYTVATEPYCNVGTFIGLGVEAVWCDSTYYAGGSIIPIYTTYTGQIGRVFTNPTNSGAELSTITSISKVSTLAATLTQISITSTTLNSNHTSLQPLQPNSTPVGPIVGGVIGGLAFIAAIAAGIFFYLRQKRKGRQTTYAPEVQTYTQPINTHSQPSEKYPATAEATFIPAEYTPPSVTPGQQTHYQQPPQPQYQQPPPVVQPPYNVYPPPQQQQPPQPIGSYLEQEQPIQQPVQQNQQYHPGNLHPQSHPPPVRPQPAPDAQRESVASSISAPGSPAPPLYTSRIPAVPEMTGVTDHHASPIDDRYEMPM